MPVLMSKKKFKKLIQENGDLRHRVKELEEILCPCEQHDFVKVYSEFSHHEICGFPEALQTRKLKCRKCKKEVIDYDGCGNHFKYEVTK